MKKIIDIYWERANLHLKLNKKINEEVYLVNGSKRINLGLIKDSEIVISVTNTPEGEMLIAGDFKIMINEACLSIDEKLISILDDKSRIFPYRNEKYAYLVSFNMDNDLIFIIKTRFVMINNKPRKFYRFNEGATGLGKLKILISVLGIFSLNVFYKFIKLFRLSNRTVLFMTENSNELSGNLKYLCNYIDKNKYKILIYAKDRHGEKSSFLNLFKATYFLAKSDTIFLDNYVQILTHINLSSDVKLIQLWHAGIGFKSVGYARFGLEGSPHPYKSCHRKYTHAIVDTEELVNVYKEVFGCKKDIIYPLGNPRTNNYLDDSVIKKTCSKLYEMNNDLKNKKVILFSPTYRGSDASLAYYDFNNIDLKKIGKFCKENSFLFIIKMHPFIREKVSIPEEYKKYILDYSDMDINELIYVSDIMITDYSSCAYEFSLFNRPLIFYRYDKVIYEYLRPMHSAKMFTSKQEEVTTFDELFDVLNKYKDISIVDRFSNVKKTKNRDSCHDIIKQCLGD